MKQLSYSSTAAFLAHYGILSNAAAEHRGTSPLSVQDQQILGAAHQLLEALAPEERTILLAYAATAMKNAYPVGRGGVWSAINSSCAGS